MVDPMTIDCPDCYSQAGISCQDDFGAPCAGRVREAMGIDVDPERQRESA